MNIRVRFAPPPTELLRIILILCFIIVPFKTNAEEIDNRNLELGAYLMTPKFSYNFWSNNVHFFINPLFDFGISAAYPLNKNKDVAGLLEVGYANYICGRGVDDNMLNDIFTNKIKVNGGINIF